MFGSRRPMKLLEQAYRPVLDLSGQQRHGDTTIYVERLIHAAPPPTVKTQSTRVV